MTVALERVAVDDAPWHEIGVGPSSTVFQGREWLRFLEDSQRAEPVVARIVADGETAGWFTGAVVRRLGLRLLGSPMPGWTTSYMGFTVDRDDVRVLAVAALRDFAFGDLRCVHLELMDRWLPSAECNLPGATGSIFHSFELALRDDETMLASMSQGARRNLRRAASLGVRVDEVDPRADPGFADEYYEQVRTAFAKRDLSPTYDVERVRSMIDHLHPSGRLLLLRASAPDGRSAATGLFPASPGGAAVFWMGASDPSLLHLRPNEALMWEGIRTWRDRGAVRFDFGGGGTFKAKFGPTPIEVPWVRCSRIAGLERARQLAASAARRAQRRGPARDG